MVQLKETRQLRRYRLPVLLVVFTVVMLVNAVVMQLASSVALLALPLGIGSAIAVVALYRKLSQVVEQRAEVPEVAKVRVWSSLWRGAVLGSGLFVLLMLLITVFGGRPDVSWGSVWGFLGTAGVTASVAVTEEVLFRGVLFRIMEERTGTMVALIVSSLVFGLAHSINADATLWGVLSIALTGGVLMTSAYIATRSLWLSIGLHFAWNFTLAGVFGVALSGSAETSHGLLQTTLSGPAVLTGGAFGPEASVLALLVCVVPTVVLLRRAARTGQVRRRVDAGV